MRFCLCFESELTQIGLPLTSDLLSELVLFPTPPLMIVVSSESISTGIWIVIHSIAYPNATVDPRYFLLTIHFNSLIVSPLSCINEPIHIAHHLT